MDFHEYLKNMRAIQKYAIEFIEMETVSGDYCQNFQCFFQNLKLEENKQVFKEFIRLISKLSENYQRKPFFFERIEQILNFFHDELHQNFTNLELFNCFINNKRILLFLFQNQYLKADQSIANLLTNTKYFNRFYPHYLFNELSAFMSSKTKNKIQNSTNKLCYNEEEFNKMKQIGENDSYICDLIRNDLNNDFISFVNHSNLPLSSTIEPSIFETNSFLIDKTPTLIEYAAFFGSTKIFKYLFLNDVELNPSLWLYVIHGRNPEIIHLLEECQVQLPGNSFKKCLMESIKCHHNELSNYIKLNFNCDQNNEEFIDFKILKYHNYKLFPHKIVYSDDLFYHLCKNSYFLLVDFFLKNKDLNVNTLTISIQFFCL